MASETFSHLKIFFTTLMVGVVILKPHYGIIIVATDILAMGHRMHRQVTRPTLFVCWCCNTSSAENKGSGTRTKPLPHPHPNERDKLNPTYRIVYKS